MSRLRRILLVRHGETDGESSIRFHGHTDVGLSEEGLGQMAWAARQVAHHPIDLVVASPLRRSWRAAWIVGHGALVRLEDDFREVHFGRWEGLTKEEIQIRDPLLYEDWQAGVDGFAYPGGESREEFQARVVRGLERLAGADAHSALLALHKGVIRVIVQHLTGEPLPLGDPPLGGVVILTRDANGDWFQGQRSSNPPRPSEEAA